MRFSVLGSLALIGSIVAAPLPSISPLNKRGLSQAAQDYLNARDEAIRTKYADLLDVFDSTFPSEKDEIYRDTFADVTANFEDKEYHVAQLKVEEIDKLGQPLPTIESIAHDPYLAMYDDDDVLEVIVRGEYARLQARIEHGLTGQDFAYHNAKIDLEVSEKLYTLSYRKWIKQSESGIRDDVVALQKSIVEANHKDYVLFRQNMDKMEDQMKAPAEDLTYLLEHSEEKYEWPIIEGPAIDRATPAYNSVVDDKVIDQQLLKDAPASAATHSSASALENDPELTKMADDEISELMSASGELSSVVVSDITRMIT